MLTLAPKNTKTQSQAAKGQDDEAWLVSICSRGIGEQWIAEII